MLASFAPANKVQGPEKKEEKKLVEDLEKLLFEEIPEMETPRIRRCEWCHQALPNDRYHLKICPQCRKESVDTFMKTH
jgi:Zn finger protein HypA/HybF involved in hydrogenase expression